MRDLQLFFRDLEQDTFTALEREIRAQGYRGLVTAYNNWLSTEAHLSRMRLPLVALNGYFDEVLSYDPGSTITQHSSLDDAAGYVRALAASRWLGRPFGLTEYNQPFWNRFRREAGLVMPAYARLQGWDFICRHGPGAIDLSFDQPWPHKKAILPYTIGLDPVARAGETLAALLFMRGDVAPAKGQVAVPFGGEKDLIGDGQGFLPDGLTTLGLLTRIGLTARPAASTGSDLAGGESTARVEDLRRAGILSPANRTDVQRRIFESETGEILMDASRRTIRVATVRTEAASFESLPAPERLGAVTLLRATGPALVAVSALDGEAVARSRRLLVIVATDAMNTGMRLRDGDRRTIEDFGHMPVLIKREEVTLAIDFAETGPAILRALHLDGEPGDAIPVRWEGHRLVVTIDNAAARHGPTTFFLVQRPPAAIR